jgi:hypothetical protein
MSRRLLPLLLLSLWAAPLSAEPLEILRKMDGYRKELPPAEAISEMNGFSFEDAAGKSFTINHLAGVGARVGAKSKGECLLLLPYLEDQDPKIRYIAGSALEKVLGCYPHGMSADDMLKIDTDGHREMVRRFAAKLEQPTDWPRPGIDVVAAGDWSEPVEGVRGRLIVTLGRTLGGGKVRETTIYLELQEVSDAVGQPKDVYFDPSHERLKCQLLDADGKEVPQGAGARSGGNPGPCWLTLPHDSTIRLPVSPYGFGRDPADGLLLPFTQSQWLIPAGQTRHLAATFTSQPPKGHDRTKVWQGTLTLPKMSVKAP